MSTERPNKLVLAVIIVLVLFSVAGIVANIVSPINYKDYPEQIQFIVRTVVWVFTATPIAIAIGFGVNLEGYLTKWLRAKRKSNGTVEYSLTWLVETLTKFEGAIIVLTPFVQTFVMNLPDEKKAIAMIVTGSAFAAVKIVLSEIKRLIAEVKANGDNG